MQNHIILLAVGLVLGIGTLALLRPTSDSGATLLVFVVLVIVYALGLVFIQLTKRIAQRSRQPLNKE
jgi:hypothetical protein